MTFFGSKGGKKQQIFVIEAPLKARLYTLLLWIFSWHTM